MRADQLDFHSLVEFAPERGTIQFPLDAPLPTELIPGIVAERLNASLGKASR